MVASGIAPRSTARFTLAAAVAAAWGPVSVTSQFGGPGGGFGGAGGGYNPPAPKCPAFRCDKGAMPVGKVDHQIWSYGCKDSGMNFLNTASFDPSNPMKGMQQKSVDKCCVERDICKQTCGLSSQTCHDNYQKCSKKICKGDQNCDMQAMLSEIMSEPHDDADKDLEKKYDPEESRCRGYNRGQKESCQCVPKDKWQDATNNKLKAFYGKFNPEKLDKDGEIKDLDEVWKKWKGKEGEMFLALTTKYKEKAVDIRVKPKPPPYTPPKDFKEDKAAAKDEPAEEEAAAPAEEVPEPKAALDADSEAFDKNRKSLEEKKRKAANDEDYDLAQTLKEDLKVLSKKEIERVKTMKNKAIEDEDFIAAKAWKARMAKLEEL